MTGSAFTVAPGEFFTLLGPSGCGKTTTLRLLAGLETPDAGEITLQGRTLAAPARNILVPIDKRNMGMVFQSYAIWPHLTVFENVAFPLRVRGESRAIIRKRVLEALEVVGLEGSKIAARPSYLAASNSVSRWRAPLSTHPLFCCSTSRYLTSTLSCASRCARNCTRCTNG